MANVIRHKRGTTDPASGSFSQTAELLVNTTDGGVFTKTDGGSVVEVGANASNLSTGTVPSGRLSGSYGISVTGSSASCTGNAATATTLQTARAINGTSFNGSADITITSNTTNALTLGSYLTGTSFNGSSAVTAAVDATSANTASKVVARDASGNFSAGTITAALSGNASTATTLQTARTIQGVSFNGSANITVVTAGTGISVSGTAVTNTGVTSLNGSTGAISNVATTNSAQSFTAAQRGSVSALTDGATITPDFSVANNFSVTLGGNRTLANPTNLTAGQSGAIAITQDGTGSRTLSFGSYWKFATGTAPTLTTTASKVDLLVYYVESSTRISAQVLLNMGG